MRKVSDFIVNKRFILLTIILVIAAISAFLATTIETNSDMTKYLSDSSNMKNGISLMESEFPGTDESSIRVMFKDLNESQIGEVKAKLESIPHVDSLTYRADDPDYNKDNYTLFVITTEYDYGTDEEKSIELALSKDFSNYDMQFNNNDIPSGKAPLGLIASALALMVIILFIMSDSWFEPIIFMVTIGVAVVINLGTNIMFPYTSELTASIAPVIQLALTMDYSIILVSRYRQEKQLYTDKKAAMKAALTNSFSSIVASALTTVVGLLVLVFLSFKLGPELGIILAKGVFVSMICVFILLPVLILGFDKWLEKSKKKSPNIPMGKLAGFSYKARFVTPVLLVVLFVSFYILKGSTGITFTDMSIDPIAEIFPKDNTIVMVYNNQDENSIENIINEIEEDDHAKSIIAYTNTLGDERTPSDMVEAIAEMNDDVKIDIELIQMLYYLYHDGQLPSISAENFIEFIKNNVMMNETLSEYIDEGMNENIDYIEKYASKETLTTKMTAKEMAEFFEMNAEDISQLYLFYYTENGGVDSGKMTLSAFADFMVNTVAKNESYASMFDTSTLSQMKIMQTYTNKAEMTKARGYKDVAAILGIEPEMVKMIYVYYQAENQDFTPSSMTLGEFVSFMQTDVANNPMFSAYVDETAFKQMAQLDLSSDVNLSHEQIAAFTGMSAENAKILFTYRDAQKGAFDKQYYLSVQGVINFLVRNSQVFGPAIGDGMADIKTAQMLIGAGVSQTAYTAPELAQFVGMEESQAESLYLLYIIEYGDTSAWQLTPQHFVSFTVDKVLPDESFADYFDKKAADDLTNGKLLIDAVVEGKEYDLSSMSELLAKFTDDVSQNDVKILYLYYAGITNTEVEEWTMTIPQMFNYIYDELMNDESYARIFDDETKNDIISRNTDLDDALKQMKGKNYSRLIITSDYPEESGATMEFMAKIDEIRKTKLEKDSYLVGMSAMVYEMNNSFNKEFTLITLITAISIFLVVLLAFRNFVVPALLTIIVQCSVFITVTIIGWQAGSMYYLSLLIVQSILMGATIDYGIVYSNYYRESRITMNKKDALRAAYNGSSHTIMTSGSILILVLAVLGIFSKTVSTAQVCIAISIGAFISVILIVFMLPGILAFFDRFVVKESRNSDN
jgi:predicted RND superfamily exporter protein